MGSRDALKNIVKFGKKEYAEKKPLSLEVLRVKSKSVLKRGMLPDLQVRQVQDARFVVVADYGEHMRLYLFSQDGALLGGENFKNSLKFEKELSKETVLEYSIPSKITKKKNRQESKQEKPSKIRN